MLRIQPALRRCLLAAVTWALCPAVHSDEPQPQPIPHTKNSSGLFYPAVARRLSQQGRVLVEFEISPKGQVVGLAVLSAEPQGMFDPAVTRYVQALQFDVPGDWEASGGTHHKYRLSFVFLLRPCTPSGPCQELEQFPADMPFKITTEPLPPPPGR